MSKFFYRMEDKKTLEGPYRHDGFWKGGYDNIVRYIMNETGEDFEMSPQRPSPFDDKENGKTLAEKVPPMKQSDAIFGFRSIIQARNWWGNNPKVYELFEKNRFVLRRYRTPERFDAKKQSVAFKEVLTDGIIIPFNKVLPLVKESVA